MDGPASALGLPFPELGEPKKHACRGRLGLGFGSSVRLGETAENNPWELR